jgi:hypothetical protein
LARLLLIRKTPSCKVKRSNLFSNTVGIGSSIDRPDDPGYFSGKLFVREKTSSIFNRRCSIDLEHPVKIEEWVALKTDLELFQMEFRCHASEESSNAELMEIYTTHVKPLVRQLLSQHGTSFTVIDLEYWHGRLQHHPKVKRRF